jgi:phospholipid/cholesterol/gamma-HCH transport system permease protein
MTEPNQSFFLFRFLTKAGEIGDLFNQTFKNIFTKSWEKKNFLQQLEEIGVKSLPIVTITAAFGGLVFGLQIYIAFTRYVGHGSEAYSGPIISLGLAKELIPVFVGLMLSGRVGSSMAAEIGTMKITEQIDALFSLGADPNRFLVVHAHLFRDVGCSLRTYQGCLFWCDHRYRRLLAGVEHGSRC